MLEQEKKDLSEARTKQHAMLLTCGDAIIGLQAHLHAISEGVSGGLGPHLKEIAKHLSNLSWQIGGSGKASNTSLTELWTRVQCHSSSRCAGQGLCKPRAFADQRLEPPSAAFYDIDPGKIGGGHHSWFSEC